MLLEALTNLNGISGQEDEIREFLKEQIKDLNCEYRCDAMGNLIVHKKGTSPRFKVMLSAHMDEVGFMVTGHTEQGLVKFKTVGGMDERILPGKRVLIGPGRIPGVIGAKPIHKQEKEERNANIKLKSMTIDIGAENREEAENLAPLGEMIAFDSVYTEFGSGCIKAKALDDRIGCAILLETLKGEYTFDLYTTFTVQEEVGLRGSEIAAFAVDPDLALVIEGTTCSDVPGVEKYEQSTELGHGAAISIMDRTSYAARNLVDYLYRSAVKGNISVQYKQTTTGGNDAGKIQQTRSGVTVASISAPCRYIHSPSSVVHKGDVESCLQLVQLVLCEMSRNQDIIEVLKNGGTVDV